MPRGYRCAALNASAQRGASSEAHADPPGLVQPNAARWIPRIPSSAFLGRPRSSVGLQQSLTPKFRVPCRASRTGGAGGTGAGGRGVAVGPQRRRLRAHALPAGDGNGGWEVGGQCVEIQRGSRGSRVKVCLWWTPLPHPPRRAPLCSAMDLVIGSRWCLRLESEGVPCRRMPA